MTIVHNYKYLEELSDEEFDALRHFIGYDVGSGMTMSQLCHAIDKMPRSQRGVLIKSKCGEERVVLPSQPVESIYLDGKLIYQSCKEKVNE